MALPKEEIKTIADIEALPEGTRAELIDGRLFLDTAPTVIHQAIVNFLVTEINIYIRSKGGKCRVFPSPFDVQLSADDIYNLVQPDISVICDRDKLSNGKRCIGAPDWVIEVVSPSTKAQDYIIKRGIRQLAFVNIGLSIRAKREYPCAILKRQIMKIVILTNLRKWAFIQIW